MDLSSSDGSAELARRCGARVIERTPHPIVEPLRNELAAVARGAWILALDPDERVTPGLARELRRIARLLGVDAAVTPRMNIDLGYPPSHPLHRYEPQIRMYLRNAVRWPEIPNTLPVVPEERLYRIAPSDDLVILHERSRNVTEIVERIGRYAPADAQAMFDRGARFTARAFLSAMASVVFKQFVRGEAWRDGVPGVLRASLLVAHKFYVWIALWQLSGSKRAAEDDRLIARIGLAVSMLWRVVAVLVRLVGFARRVVVRFGGRSARRSPVAGLGER
jgi:hypothetical protein